ncbi:unnamed protein product [Hermetia illucens]|uniref:Uncharacterized protein n=1 Tax=Hermetia illucens TaxID=343691 RepID=A0A7R8YTD2_HERIL|nr:unnamed protein product [Hermetia illucens]
MEEQKKNEVTVQGFGNPVPAAFGSEQADSRPSVSNDCSASVVGTLATVASNVTSVREELELAPVMDPFRRSSIFRRSPPTRAQAPTIATPSGKRIAGVFEEEESLTPIHPSDALGNDQSGAAFTALGKKIMELCEFIKERRNIHQNIRAMIRGIRLTYGKAQVERIGKVNQATQVTPVQNTKGEKAGKRLREKLNDSTGQQTPKRKKDSTPKKAEFMKSTSEATRENTAVATSRKGIEPSKADAEAWRKVEPRKRNYRRKIRPEVIFISKRGEGSYADILRKVKADPELTNLGNNVSRIRRSQKGDLMLELKKSKDVTADKFLS